ncbi:hypothetical protein [Alicyclobacillus sp. SP_1]|uniref:lysine 5,6-aminomutase reactivase subunit KamB n=1 Tax=Alicyclobacillus sp. SP_1 TaxID=2942475 RepID=UPI0021573AB3|nr:hypothetical protein [Alicyclobacillus sp. SP_1]
MKLLPLCEERGLRRIAFVGATKHAGKTTAMNAFLREFAASSESQRSPTSTQAHGFESPSVQPFRGGSASDIVRPTVGICSIGLDGERLDAILGLAKPPVEVAAGTLVATAERAIAAASAPLEWLFATGIHSPLGEVVVVRATESTNVLLAGVRSRQHVATVMEALRRFGADYVLVDGAFDRVAAAAPGLVDAVVLAVGAVSGRTVSEVVRHAAYVSQRFLLPPASPEVRALFADAVASDHIGIAYASGVTRLFPREQSAEFAHGLFAANEADGSAVTAVYVPGAVGDRLLQAAVSSERPVTVVVAHPAQLLAEEKALSSYWQKGHTLVVWTPLPLLAIAANPVHILGHALDRGELLREMSAAFPNVAVYDALEG